MAIGIVTDSAASLPAEIADRLGVVVVPMWLTIDGVREREGSRPLAEVAVARDVTTESPSALEYRAAILAAGGEHGAVVVTVAATMSESYSAAYMAARSVGPQVRVVDTSTAAGAEGLVVMAAAQAAQRGADLAAVEDEARRVADSVRLVATMPNLEHLARSGRVPEMADWACRRTGVAPLFEFVDGKTRTRRPALSREGALDRMVGRVLRSRLDPPGSPARLHVAALHALDDESGRALLEAVCAHVEPATAFVGEFGAAMLAHTGAGVTGLAWYWDRP